MYSNQLETQDLILGKMKPDDAQKMLDNFWRHEQTAKYMLWPTTNNYQDAVARVERSIKFQAERMAYTVYEKSSGEPIGLAGMIEVEPNVWEDAGIGVGPKFVGKGYGTQILKALVDECFRIGATKIICSCFKDNLPSKKMQIKFGFEYTHSEEKIREKDGLKYVADFHVLTKEKYQSLYKK